MREFTIRSVPPMTPEEAAAYEKAHPKTAARIKRMIAENKGPFCADCGHSKLYHTADNGQLIPCQRPNCPCRGFQP